MAAPADATLIEFALAAWIEALPQCQAVGAKVYPWARAPQEVATRPFVLYHRVSGGRVRSLNGPSGVSRPKIQLDVVARDYLAVRRLTSQIREALEALDVNSDVGGRTVQVAVADDEFDQSGADVRPEHGTEQTEHRGTIEVTIWFVEATQ